MFTPLASSRAPSIRVASSLMVSCLMAAAAVVMVVIG
jgi:hypothetical protein